MKIGYELSEKDYVDFNINHYKTNEGMKKYARNTGLVTMGLVFIICIVFGVLNVMKMWKAVITGIIASILTLVFFKSLLMKEVEKTAGKMLNKNDTKTLLAYRELELREDGIHNESEFEESLIKWGAIEEISETDEHIFIYNSSVSALMVPKKVFKSEEEQKAFMGIIKEKTA